MQIISAIFWFFVAFIFIIIYISNKIFKKNKVLISKVILLISSYLFIIYADFRFSLILFLLTIVTWWSAKKRIYMKWGIIFSIFALGYFKYTNFFIGSFSKLFRLGDNNNLLNIILPLGISFYTFSAISYIVDVHRKKIERHSLFDVALYLSFFPKLTSGPIQRSEDFFKQINQERNVGFCSFTTGIQIFCFGLFKKIVLADRLSVFVNQVYETPFVFNSATVALAVVAYSFQIYFDFSGYSDMAIGVARILDVKLPRNFNLPYLSHNVTEFWKRWHITLSSWLQEYLYIPLGGNRKGIFRTYLNLILTMLIGGLWHGSAWTYVVWGLLNGLALVVHKIWVKRTQSNIKEHSLFGNIISIIGTFVFISMCWIFFRADSVINALDIIYCMFSFKTGVMQPYFWLFIAFVIYISTIIFASKKSKKLFLEKRKNNSWINGFYPIGNLSRLWHLVFFFVFVGLIFGLAYTGGSPFIYGAY